MKITNFEGEPYEPTTQRTGGGWYHKETPQHWTNRWICSECGYLWVFPAEEGKYCPNCGDYKRFITYAGKEQNDERA